MPLVRERQQNMLDTSAMGCEHLVSNTTNWEDVASECDFTRHGCVTSYRFVQQEGSQCECGCHTCGRPILRDSTCWEVYMDVVIVEGILRSIASCDEVTKYAL